MCAALNSLNSETFLTGSFSPYEQCRIIPIDSKNPIAQSEVFSAYISDKQHSRKKWKFWDSNSGLPGYEPDVLTAELNFLSRSSIPDCRFWVDLLLLLRFFATSRNKGHGKIEYLVFTRIPIRDIWNPFNQLRWARWVFVGGSMWNKPLPGTCAT